MLAIPELAMPRSRKVTTVCNGRREVWTDYEQAKAYFLEPAHLSVQKPKPSAFHYLVQ